MKTNKILTNKGFIKFFAAALFLLVAQAGFAQDPGGGPDGPPPAVPLDDYLMFIPVVVGLVVAFFYFRKVAKNNAVA